MAAVTETVDGWFRRRGLTPLLSGTPLATSPSERATPALVVWFLLMMVSTTLTTALGLGQALLLGAAVVVGTWVASTMIRRRRPLSR
ncbi:hypothetical protein [Propioniciclava tarda]|uniref:Uncharacterized protein n=1 Tax=Propioniciclava tarda TaxID=433330 RepID=A0A4Q9KJ03_PROTD|nr:hypothetical protein [Propioniciclava tarda]TBT94383.1 hypothetical protein ET996_11135 [Propioniciclava tarda]SMO72630.1 hypothetical protein SAMN06266982_11472 [Propioniciclava tarda]